MDEGRGQGNGAKANPIGFRFRAARLTEEYDKEASPAYWLAQAPVLAAVVQPSLRKRHPSP